MWVMLAVRDENFGLILFRFSFLFFCAELFFAFLMRISLFLVKKYAQKTIKYLFLCQNRRETEIRLIRNLG